MTDSEVWCKDRIYLARFVLCAGDSFAALGGVRAICTRFLRCARLGLCYVQEVPSLRPVRFVLCAGDSFAALGISVPIGSPIFRAKRETSPRQQDRIQRPSEARYSERSEGILSWLQDAPPEEPLPNSRTPTEGRHHEGPSSRQLIPVFHRGPSIRGSRIR